MSPASFWPQQSAIFTAGGIIVVFIEIKATFTGDNHILQSRITIFDTVVYIAQGTSP